VVEQILTEAKIKNIAVIVFQNGEFVGGETTVEEFQEFCRKKMIENGTPKLLAWVFTRGMKRLERWNKK